VAAANIFLPDLLAKSMSFSNHYERLVR